MKELSILILLVSSLAFVPGLQAQFGWPIGPGTTPMSMTDTSLRRQFTLEMIHKNGHIDTLEQLVERPSLNMTVAPAIVRTGMNLSAIDTVYLRVREQITGWPVSDSTSEFANEIYLGGYEPDTSFALKPGTALSQNAKNILLKDIYPNPVVGHSFNILAAAPDGIPCKLLLYDVLGNVIASNTFKGSGRWETIEFQSPETSGMYYIVASAGAEYQVLSVSIVK